MPDITFVDNDTSSANRINAAWLNMANRLVNDIGSGASGLVGAGLEAWRPANTHPTGSVGKALSDRVWSITDAPYSAVGDGVTDNYAAILAAQTALAAAGGGTLLIPEGTFRIATAIPRVAGVDYEGLGWASILKPDGCSAFTYGYTSGFGRSATRNMWIQGSSGATQIGIYQAGTLDDADELYGVEISDCAITGFLTGMQFRTIRNFTFENNWLQDVTSGIKLVGKCLTGFLNNNKIVEAAGPGVGTKTGIYLAAFNYTSGAGTVGPEGIRIEAPYVQGFDYGIDIGFVTEGRITNPDISSNIVGVRFSSANSLSILGGYVQLSGAASTFGIHAAAQGVVNSTKYLIKGVNINAAGGAIPASASGLMVGTRAVTGNVDYLTVEDCEFSGWTGYDIEQTASGNNHYLRNHCASTGAVASMFFETMFAARPTYVDGNACADTINYALTEVGLILGSNTIAGVIDKGGSQTLTGAGAVSRATLRTNIVTTGANALTLADGYEGQEKFIVMKTDGGDGTLTPTNLYNGTTITFNDVGDSAHLLFTDSQWVFLGGTATLA